ncbi:MAG: hypothetical protein JXJ22_14795 [Bacteroidales bacterium]|nr:hypothetical protein [Bacteroidales bacterium]
MSGKKIILFTVFVFFSVLYIPAQSRTVKKAERNKEKTEKSEARRYEIARKKTIKRRMEMQSPNTKEMMKDGEKRANKFNNRTRWTEKIFRKRKIKKRT